MFALMLCAVVPMSGLDIPKEDPSKSGDQEDNGLFCYKRGIGDVIDKPNEEQVLTEGERALREREKIEKRIAFWEKEARDARAEEAFWTRMAIGVGIFAVTFFTLVFVLFYTGHATKVEMWIQRALRIRKK